MTKSALYNINRFLLLFPPFPKKDDFPCLPKINCIYEFQNRTKAPPL